MERKIIQPEKEKIIFLFNHKINYLCLSPLPILLDRIFSFLSLSLSPIYSLPDACIIECPSTMPKKALDANKPRGPVTAYALFVQTCRSELRRKYPQLAVDYNVIVKKCSERWKAMNETEKKRFNETAEMHRKRYKEELANYQQEQQAKQQQQSATSSILLPNPSSSFLIESSSVPQVQQQNPHPLMMPTTNLQHATTLVAPVVQPKKPARKRKPKDPHAPKKPLSAYFLFCADERPKVHGSQTGNN